MPQLRFGRKISMLVASFLLLLSGITITFSPSMPVFIIIRCTIISTIILIKPMITTITIRGVVGASSTALFASGFVHALEMVCQPFNIHCSDPDMKQHITKFIAILWAVQAIEVFDLNQVGGTYSTLVSFLLEYSW